MREDDELKEFRDLMTAPDHWEDGFGIKSMIGGVFVGMIMTPASMYMGLVMGQDLGAAAQWVTIILFMEVARRAFTTLKRPEIYVLYYMAGATVASSNIAWGSGLLWQQYMPQNDSFRYFGIADKLPHWVAPTDPAILGTRSLFNRAWAPAIGLMILGQVLSRFNYFGLGYVLFRLTSDVEHLAFPMAPVGALGVSALADASSGHDTWRWRVFSFGAMLGMLFGLVYIALPAITGVFLPRPIAIFPIPWTDLTGNGERILPAVPIVLSFNLGMVLAGMVLPFSAMVGSFVGLLMCAIANPVLHHYRILHTWQPGLGAIETLNANTLDFYLSFGMGLTFAIAVIGIIHVVTSLAAGKKSLDDRAATNLNWRTLLRPPSGRGDISIWLALFFYSFTTIINIVVACWLLQDAHATLGSSAVTKGLVAVFVFYGFVYTPVLSYVSARVEGLVGQSVQLPYVREATFILSGYKGAAIWFVPFPAYNYSWQALSFRQTELTGTKFTSMLKAEIFMLPIVVVSMLVFSQFLWSIAPIPSSAFPFARVIWPFIAFRQSLIYSSTLPGNEHSQFYQSLMPGYIGLGLGFALLVYAGLAFFGMPVLLVYGMIRGMDGSIPDFIIPQFIGALFGRYYFAKKFGKQWPEYRVVFFAGYSCGVGLLSMLALGFVVMSKSVVPTLY